MVFIETNKGERQAHQVIDDVTLYHDVFQASVRGWTFFSQALLVSMVLKTTASGGKVGGGTD